MNRALILAIMGLAVAVGAYFAYLRRDGRLTAPPAVELCTRDLHKLFRENSTTPLSKENARGRCECINRELEKSDEGREVLRVVVEHKKFLDIIESAASHAAAFEAMSLCNH